MVEICWSSESAGTVTDAGLAAADRDTVVLGFFEPARVPPVRVVVNAAAVKLTGEQREHLQSPEILADKRENV